jgi:YD repeat-containing protein
MWPQPVTATPPPSAIAGCQIVETIDHFRDGTPDGTIRKYVDQMGYIVRMEWDINFDGEIDSTFIYHRTVDGMTSEWYRFDRDGVISTMGRHAHYLGGVTEIRIYARKNEAFGLVLLDFYYYDGDGRMIKEAHGSNGDGIVDEIVDLVYDRSGRLVSRYYTTSDRKFVSEERFEWGEFGISRASLIYRQGLYYTEDMYYDHKGRLSEIVHRRNDPRNTTDVSTLKYDGQDRLIEIKSNMQSSGRISELSQYTYDDLGRITTRDYWGALIYTSSIFSYHCE